MMMRILPNRYIALLMTPREASMLEGQILDPQQFPWQDSETELIGLQAKSMIHEAVAQMTVRELDAAISSITMIAQAEGAVEEKMEIHPLCPECEEADLKYFVDNDIWICPNCGHEAKLQSSETSEEQAEEEKVNPEEGE